MVRIYKGITLEKKELQQVLIWQLNILKIENEIID